MSKAVNDSKKKNHYQADNMRPALPYTDMYTPYNKNRVIPTHKAAGLENTLAMKQGTHRSLAGSVASKLSRSE
jgi:hypothetical protein